MKPAVRMRSACGNLSTFLSATEVRHQRMPNGAKAESKCERGAAVKPRHRVRVTPCTRQWGPFRSDAIAIASCSSSSLHGAAGARPMPLCFPWVRRRVRPESAHPHS